MVDISAGHCGYITYTNRDIHSLAMTGLIPTSTMNASMVVNASTGLNTSTIGLNTSMIDLSPTIVSTLNESMFTNGSDIDGNGSVVATTAVSRGNTH